MDAGEKWELAQPLVYAAFGPVEFEADFVAVEEPGGGLFEGLFEVVGQRELPGACGVAREDVASNVCDALLIGAGAEGLPSN
jgi:hypothetical protein